MAVNVNHMRDCLRQFDFQRLFVEELGWSQPSNRQAVAFTVRHDRFFRHQVAQLAGVVVFEVTAEGGRIPDAQSRAAVHKEIAKHYHENLLIFLDQDHTQSLWYWVKRQEGKTFPREHLYVQGGIRLRRDNWVSVMYAEGLNSTTSSGIFQRTDRQGILGQKPVHCQRSS